MKQELTHCQCLRIMGQCLSKPSLFCFFAIEKIENIGDTPIRDTLMMVGQWPVLDRNWDPNGRHFLKRTLIANSLSTTAVAASTKVDHFMPLTIENLLGKIRGDYNQPIIIEQYVGPDDRNSSHNIIQFDQTSFGLPSREYFLKEGANKEKEAYLHLMVDVAELLGAEREYAFEQMRNVLEFETELANVGLIKLFLLFFVLIQIDH